MPLFRRRSKVPEAQRGFPGMEIPTSPDPAAFARLTTNDRPGMYAPNGDTPRPPPPEQAIKQSHLMERQQQLKRNASKERVRELRSLIREKRRQDIEIWKDRDVLDVEKKDMRKRCAESDGLLRKILGIVEGWEKDQFTDAEWVVAREIKEKVTTASHISWEAIPVWDREEPDDMYKFGWT